MEIKEMSITELMERRQAIATEIDAPEADLDALETEARSINAEIEARQAEAVKKAEIRDQIAKGAVGIIKEERKEDVVKMSNAEIRKSHEYNMAYAEYIKTGNDQECRALLTENVSGTVPVAEYAENRVRTAWDREGIMSRVRKTFMKGNLKIGFEISADGAYVHTEAANTATTEEALVLGIVNLIPASIKKWINCQIAA